jgi:hypothetical protein
MQSDDIGIKSYKSADERSFDTRLQDLLQTSPIPREQLLENLGLFLNPKNFSRMLFMHHIYSQIIDVPGVVFDLGTRWGQNLSLFSTFRGMYEPFNRHRKLVGFDTFSGFPSVSSEDGTSDLMRSGNVSVTDDYISYLDELMTIQEQMSPLSHIKKFELIAGDATKTVPAYLKENTETIIALAYFDFDLYEPTKICLEAISDRLVQGSIVGFDELNDPDSPGETVALMEVFGLRNIKLRRWPNASRASYFVVE